MITTFYAGALALLFAKISWDTIRARRSHRISLGLGDEGEIAALVSAHSNFSSYAIFLLFLTFLVERSGRVPGELLHVMGGTFTLGRVLHYQAFRAQPMQLKKRVLGMKLTLGPLILLGLLSLYIAVTGWI